MRFDDVDAPAPPCQSDPDLWFSEDEADKDKARGVCSTCPFQVACRELSEQPVYVLDTSYSRAEFGVWGGVDSNPDVEALSPKQRQMAERAGEVKALLAEGLSKYAIGKKLNLGSGSVNHIVNNYLKEDAA